MTGEITERVRICVWCLPLTIRFLEPPHLVPPEYLRIEMWGVSEKKHLRVTVMTGYLGFESRNVDISEGICPECDAKERARGGLPAGNAVTGDS